ncbi:glyoxalase [Arsenicitalea aurantiaca]|uniref:Glyoxalase n=1 Tax=Arsenicitalea aurantiaca TaxID=1783274 RepID=A0A433X5X2_9HYPH|nr:VOC family protein [Arsenicitalea aurantiaca]RUT29463.1 glyoxalase [Arsenicitalea aurantiaca]
MASPDVDPRTPLIATLRYRDADAALDWLKSVFGFKEHALYRNEEGTVAHAELAFGNGMIMLGPVADTPFGRFMRQPGDVGAVTMSLYVIVPDPDAHHARSVAAGFEILLPLRDESYGGREYSVKDPEGHVWTFGTYDPYGG